MITPQKRQKKNFLLCLTTLTSKFKVHHLLWFMWMAWNTNNKALDRFLTQCIFLSYYSESQMQQIYDKLYQKEEGVKVIENIGGGWENWKQCWTQMSSQSRYLYLTKKLVEHNSAYEKYETVFEWTELIWVESFILHALLWIYWPNQYIWYYFLFWTTVKNRFPTFYPD